MIELCNSYECTGCSMCYNICNHNAISMQPDEEGFLQPRINPSKCIDCGLCRKICPVLSPYDFSNHKMHTYAAFAKDKGIRQHGSSGGLFSVFANYILSSNGYVAGAAYNRDYAVNHIIISDITDLYKLQGSKYVQSNLKDTPQTIKSLLNNGKNVLFVGTPCQVAGLLNYLKKPYNNLFTIDLVCHGVPSPKLFARYINHLKNKYPTITQFHFRDLSKWSCNSSITYKSTFSNRWTNKQLYDTDMGYFSLFINNYINRECCYKCTYAHSSGRVGDITLADFWGIGKAKPYKHDTSLGVSFVSVNTIKGKDLFESIKPDIEYEEREIEETINGGNSQLKQPSQRPTERDNIYKQAYQLEWTDFIKKQKIPLKKKISLKKRIANKLWKIIKK